MKTETPTKLINLVFAIFYEEEVGNIHKLYSKVCEELSNIEFVGDENQPFYDLICNRITKKIIELFILSDYGPIERDSLLSLMDLLYDTKIKVESSI